MTDPQTGRLRVEGVPEFWATPSDAPADSDLSSQSIYRPAVLVECTLNFRSLRAGLNHSEDRSFASWLPEEGLAIDWDAGPFDDGHSFHLETTANSEAEYCEGAYSATRDTLRQYQDELVEKIIRNERLKLVYSPEFELFSSPEEPLEDFLSQVAEAALRRVEPALKSLRRKFELQLEQIRETQMRKGLKAEGLGLDLLQIINSQLSESENRLASIFSTLAGTVFGSTEPRHESEPDTTLDRELKEDLERMEQEASDALRSLYDEYMTLANEYDTFEIGLQSDNVQVLRVALLWAPTPDC